MKKQGFILIAIFIGGALGTMFRYTINLQVIHLLFPLGTVVENVIGSLLLGAVTGYILIKKIPVVLKEGIGVGFCGGFTTMSTLAADTVHLVGEAHVESLLVYISVSLFGGLLAAFFGMKLGSVIARSKQKEGAAE
nr:CrcB family protein [Evansella caseinilytica]